MWINVGTMMDMSEEAHESWPANIGAYCQERQTDLHPVHLIN